VAAELTGRGVRSYLPLFREVHRWKDRKKVVELPVFPGYVLPRFSAPTRAGCGSSKALGVVRILGPANASSRSGRGGRGCAQTARLRRRGLSHPFLREGPGCGSSTARSRALKGCWSA